MSNDRDIYECQHGARGHYQPGTFEIEGKRPFADFRPIPLPRRVDPQPVADARRMLARGRAMRAMEAMSGTERVGLALAPGLEPLTPAELDHWSAVLAEEAVCEGRIHRKNLTNPHD